MSVKEVVVVEGYHDLSRIKSVYPDMDIVITNGSEISEETLNELKLLNEKRGLILFLDPDYQGERIRKRINDFVGETKHVFLPKEKCINKSKTKVGIEHALKEDIIDAFNNIMKTNVESSKNITFQDLYTLKLIGCAGAKQNRKILTDTIGIGLSNGKTILNKLNMFGVTTEEISEILRK